MSDEVVVLDHGYVKFVERWGSDERIIEAARMSTQKGFEGWGPTWKCSRALCDWRGCHLPKHEDQPRSKSDSCPQCGATEICDQYRVTRSCSVTCTRTTTPPHSRWVV